MGMSTFTYDYGSILPEPSNKFRSHHVFNSASKLQDFFGVDDIDELKIEPTQSRKIKNIFSSTNNHQKKRRKKLKRDSKKIQRSLNKLRKETKTEKSSKPCKLFV